MVVMILVSKDMQRHSNAEVKIGSKRVSLALKINSISNLAHTTSPQFKNRIHLNKMTYVIFINSPVVYTFQETPVRRK